MFVYVRFGVSHTDVYVLKHTKTRAAFIVIANRAKLQCRCQDAPFVGVVKKSRFTTNIWGMDYKFCSIRAASKILEIDLSLTTKATPFSAPHDSTTPRVDRFVLPSFSLVLLYSAWVYHYHHCCGSPPIDRLGITRSCPTAIDFTSFIWLVRPYSHLCVVRFYI